MPFGLEYFNQSEQPSFDYPVQESYQSNLANSFGPSFQTPAMDAYKSYLSGVPKQEDYQGGFLQKLLAGIAGFASGVKDPARGIQTGMSIMDAPYLRALQQYQVQEPGLRQAASMEERSLADRVNLLKAIQENNRYNQEFGLKQNQFGLEQQKFGLSQQELQLEQAKLKLDEAYKTGQLSNEQYQNATARINAIANQGQSQASANQSNAMAGYYTARTQNPSAFMSGDDPSVSLIKMQIQQRLMSDPRMMGAFEDGQFNPSELNPEQLAVYQQILREAGIYNSFGAR